MDSGVKSALRSFFVPGGALLAGIVGLLHARVLIIASAQVADFYWYVAFAAGALLAWRFQSVRALFLLIVFALATLAPAVLTGNVVLSAVAILLPLDLILFSLPQEHGFSVADFAIGFAFLFLQFVAIALLARPELSNASKVLDHSFSTAPWMHQGIPQVALLGFAIALLTFLVRYLLHRSPIETGCFWATASAFAGVRAGSSTMRTFYMATAAVLIGVALVEHSYRMAFQDELTGLPARRAFNEAVRKLRADYAVAMVDIDFFKKFNDEFGHDTGDQVLRMVASRIARVGGSGQAYRFGGEEFCVLFAGTSIQQAFALMDTVRQEIADSRFVVRGPDRDIRSSEHRSAKERRGMRDVQVTVSVGVATPTARTFHVDEIIVLADEALYAAKRNGRNRVQSSTASKPTPTLSR
ncbi:MAG TPA: GGDEF domain-containing protein [Clostridia bacterium]|nr:GGDEF domain-containing protein [Clostridia bacterium]